MTGPENKGKQAGAAPDPNWLRLLPINEVRLSDQQWESLAEWQLPANARSLIGRALMFYRVCKNALEVSGPPDRAKTGLSATAKNADELARELNRIAANPLAVYGLASAIDRSDPSLPIPAAARENLLTTVGKLRSLSSYLAQGSKKIAQGRSGAHQRSLLISLLVDVLGHIFEEFTGRSLSRSQKGRNTPSDFIHAVVRIADPSVGRSSIDEAMKRRIKSHGEIREPSSA